MNSVDIVHAFWDEVWNAHDPDAVDHFVVDDFVIVSGGEAIHGRVASRWLVTGKNNGYLGAEADQRVIAMTGTAVWAVGADGKLLSNHVERSAWEVHRQLTA